MKLLSKRCVARAPRPGTLLYELLFNRRASGNGKMRMRMLDISDDIPDRLEIAFSEDGGQSWPQSLPIQLSQKRPDGVLRRFFGDWFVDPSNDRQILFILEALFSGDLAVEGYSKYYLRYRTSDDGGLSALVDEQVIQDGYTAEHPLPGQWVGHNGLTTPGGNSTLRLPDGKLLVATNRTVLGPDGKWWNPGNSYGFFEVLMLFGRWSGRRIGAIDWTAGPTIGIDPSRTTRGLSEPTLALMDDGRILMVARGSNESSRGVHQDIGTHKWKCVSTDGGATWSGPEPWTYEDGSTFYSSSSISTFLQHSNGQTYWIGHISPVNCQGNHPRDHLYIARVDPTSLGLIRDSVFLIDSRQPDEPPLQISCLIRAHEDRPTGEIVVNAPRYLLQSAVQWGGDSYEYRLSP